MASLQNDDCLLVGRKNVDYKVSYQELLGSIEKDLSLDNECPVYEIIDDFVCRVDDFASMNGPRLKYKQTIQNSPNWIEYNEGDSPDYKYQYSVIPYDEAYKHEGIKIKQQGEVLAENDLWVSGIIRSWSHRVLEDGRHVICFQTLIQKGQENSSKGNKVTLRDCSAVYWDDIEDKPCIPKCPPCKPAEVIDSRGSTGDMLKSIYPNEELIEESPNFNFNWAYTKIVFAPGFKKENALVFIDDEGDTLTDRIKAYHHVINPVGDDKYPAGTEFIYLQFLNDYYTKGCTLTLADCAPTLNDGKLTIKDKDDNVVVSFSANQAEDVTVNLPSGFSGDYRELENQPDIPSPANDGKLTILNGRGREIGTFSANHEGDAVITIPTDSQNYDQDPPRHPSCLHIKNVRGGALKLIMRKSSYGDMTAVEVLGEGNHNNLSNFCRETKRYLSTLMIFGMEPDGQEPPRECLRFGDISAPGCNGLWGGEFDGDNDSGYELLEKQGYNYKNFCGTTTYVPENNGEDWGRLQPWIHILPEALIKNEDDEWVAVPNNYEYLVYYWPPQSPTGNHDCWIYADPGTTYELGQYTDTAKTTSFKEFFSRGANTAPVSGYRYMDVSNCQNFEKMFYGNETLAEIPDIRFWDVSSGKNFAKMFEQCPNFDADLSHWDMRNAEDISYMFSQCDSFSCGRRDSALRGLGQWRLPKLGKALAEADQDAARATTQTMYQCYALAFDLRDWECPYIPEIDLNVHLRSGNQTGIRFQNGRYLNGHEVTSRGGGLCGVPWDDRHFWYPKYAYYNSNAFVQTPITGPDRYEKDQYGNDTKYIIDPGKTKHFNLDRKKVWQEYIDWSDRAVMDRVMETWESPIDEESEQKAKFEECLAKDDELLEYYFDTNWGQISVKGKDGKSDRTIDEGNNLADKPAWLYCKPGETCTLEPEWTNERFWDLDIKKDFRAQDTAFEYTIKSGDASINDPNAWKPVITCNGNVNDVVVVEMKLTMKYWKVEGEDSPFNTQEIKITLADSKQDAIDNWPDGP